MTSAQIAAVQHIQIFARGSCLTAEDPGQYISYSYSAFAELGCLRGKKEKRIGERRDICGIGGRYHKKMKITIRNGDWTFCKYTKFNLDNMSGNRHWEHVLGRSKELRMGLEIRGKQKEVLVPIINKLKKFEFNIGGGESLVAEEKATENGWMGPIEEYPQKETWEGPEYYVATVV